jgi:hypothetical protein
MPKLTDWRDELRTILGPKIRAAGILPTARKLKLSDAVLHRWLGGNSSLGEENLIALADLFGYEITLPSIRKKPDRD